MRIQIAFLAVLIALPLAADETRTFRCPETLTVKMNWPSTIAADGPHGKITLKLLDAPRTYALPSDGGPVLWVPFNAVTCMYSANFDLQARYGNAGPIESCPAVEVPTVWPASVGSNPRYDINKAAPDPSTGIKFEAQKSKRPSDTCTYLSNRGGFPGFYGYPRAAGDQCTVNYDDDTVTCVIKK